MGASELLLNYYTMSSMPSASSTAGLEGDWKQECVDLTDSDPVFIKEEKGCYDEYTDDRPHLQQQPPLSDEPLDDDDASDCDSDLSGQLKVVINDDEHDELAADKSDQEAAAAEVSQSSEKARFWREQLDTGNFKIRKSQRKSGLQQQTLQQQQGGAVALPVLGKDKWAVKIKDTQTEAFYNLPVVQSLQEARVRIEQEMSAATVAGDPLALPDVVRAIEEGCSGPIWRTLLLQQAAADGAGYVLRSGDLLLLAAKLGYCDIIGLVLRAGVDVNYQNEEGTTALMTACEYVSPVLML